MGQKDSRSGGIFLALGVLGGLAAGAALGNAMAGILAGTVLGAGAALLLWLADRRRSAR